MASGSRPVRAILFDLDETLTFHERLYEGSYLALLAPHARAAGEKPEAMVETAKRLAAEMGEGSPAAEYLTAIGIGGRDVLWCRFGGEHPQLKVLAAWAPGFRTAFWRAVLEAHGVGADGVTPERLAERHQVDIRSRAGAFGDARRALDRLAGRWPLAMVTNGMPEGQREKAQLGGVDMYFDPAGVFTSGEVGVGKPDPAIFEMALDWLGVPGSDAVMVGDSATRDVPGALAAGIRSVWVNRNGTKWDHTAPRPDAEIASLDELEKVLGRV